MSQGEPAQSRTPATASHLGRSTGSSGRASVGLGSVHSVGSASLPPRPPPPPPGSLSAELPPERASLDEQFMMYMRREAAGASEQGTSGGPGPRGAAVPGGGHARHFDDAFHGYGGRSGLPTAPPTAAHGPNVTHVAWTHDWGTSGGAPAGVAPAAAAVPDHSAWPHSHAQAYTPGGGTAAAPPMHVPPRSSRLDNMPPPRWHWSVPHSGTGAGQGGDGAVPWQHLWAMNVGQGDARSVHGVHGTAAASPGLHNPGRISVFDSSPEDDPVPSWRRHAVAASAQSLADAAAAAASRVPAGVPTTAFGAQPLPPPPYHDSGAHRNLGGGAGFGHLPFARVAPLQPSLRVPMDPRAPLRASSVAASAASDVPVAPVVGRPALRSDGPLPPWNSESMKARATETAGRDHVHWSQPQPDSASTIGARNDQQDAVGATRDSNADPSSLLARLRNSEVVKAGGSIADALRAERQRCVVAVLLLLGALLTLMWVSLSASVCRRFKPALGSAGDATVGDAASVRSASQPPASAATFAPFDPHSRPAPASPASIPHAGADRSQPSVAARLPTQRYPPQVAGAAPLRPATVDGGVVPAMSAAYSRHDHTSFMAASTVHGGANDDDGAGSAADNGSQRGSGIGAALPPSWTPSGAAAMVARSIRSSADAERRDAASVGPRRVLPGAFDPARSSGASALASQFPRTMAVLARRQGGSPRGDTGSAVADDSDGTPAALGKGTATARGGRRWSRGFTTANGSGSDSDSDHSDVASVVSARSQRSRRSRGSSRRSRSPAFPAPHRHAAGMPLPMPKSAQECVYDSLVGSRSLSRLQDIQRIAAPTPRAQHGVTPADGLPMPLPVSTGPAAVLRRHRDADSGGSVASGSVAGSTRSHRHNRRRGRSSKRRGSQAEVPARVAEAAAAREAIMKQAMQQLEESRVRSTGWWIGVLNCIS